MLGGPYLSWLKGLQFFLIPKEQLNIPMGYAAYLLFYQCVLIRIVIIFLHSMSS